MEKWNPETQTKLLIDSLIERAAKGDKQGLKFADAIKKQDKKIILSMLLQESENMKKRILKHISEQ